MYTVRVCNMDITVGDRICQGQWYSACMVVGCEGDSVQFVLFFHCLLSPGVGSISKC